MILKRFPEEKQDQIEQLIVYVELMGLTGRDLVAIGGKMDREEASIKKNRNMEIIKSFDCLTIGRDSRWDVNERFKLKTAQGTYNFFSGSWEHWEVTSLSTKKKHSHRPDVYSYDLPKTDWRTRIRYAILLDIAFGKFLLDF
jgi:hypothetical protein